MKMGRERNVTRWDVHAAQLKARMDAIHERLVAASSEDTARKLRDELRALESQYRALGPSPRAKMG